MYLQVSITFGFQYHALSSNLYNGGFSNTCGKMQDQPGNFLVLAKVPEVKSAPFESRLQTSPDLVRGSREKPLKRWIPLWATLGIETLSPFLNGSEFTTSLTASAPRGEFVDVERLKVLKSY
ncbi:hypothetical protein CDAR_75271 [Caerostris darwini]|uniref:Uncharacterized protein n=1 Tax=Caerostris darwini TaxID=1538125 RepID=A0AAV4QVK6_9ARAC|nr:hypothetical protein CDAR_75271 [Caerostris darwini]